MRRPVLLALLSVAVLGAPRASARSPFHQRRPTAPTVVQVQSLIEEVDTSSLPTIQLPVLAPKSAPETLPDGPPELRLEEITSTPAPRQIPRTSAPRAPTPMRLKLTAPGVLGAGFNPQPEGHSAAFAVSCSSSVKGAGKNTIHWEALLPTPGGAKLLRGQAWLDLRTCKLGEASRAEAQLRTVLSVDGKPLVYAARVEDELLFVTPLLHVNPSHLLTDQVGSTPTFQRGPISMTRVRAIRGGAAVFSAGLMRHVALDWWRSLGLNSDPENLPSAPPYQLRLDLSQAASEPAPLALLTLQRPVAVQQPAAALLDTVGVSPTPPRAVPRKLDVFF